MTVRDDFEADMAAEFANEELTVEISYNGGDPIFAQVAYENDPERGQTMHAARAVLKVLKSDVPSPAYGVKVTIDSVEWTVNRILSGNGFSWRVQIHSDVRKAIK